MLLRGCRAPRGPADQSPFDVYLMRLWSPRSLLSEDGALGSVVEPRAGGEGSGAGAQRGLLAVSAQARQHRTGWASGSMPEGFVLHSWAALEQEGCSPLCDVQGRCLESYGTAYEIFLPRAASYCGILAEESSSSSRVQHLGAELEPKSRRHK